MGKIYAFTNQKGGVGKTTSVINIGCGLNLLGYKVLFIDMDPQCNLSSALGGELGKASSREVLLGEIRAEDAIQKVPEGYLIPASPNLSTLDMELKDARRAFKLKDAIEGLRNSYDYIILDSPPTLGVVTINILVATDEVYIPVILDVFSLQGVGQLFRSILAVKDKANPSLKVGGIFITRSNQRLTFNRQIRELLDDVAAKLDTRIMETSIREGVGVREAASRRQSIFVYSPRCKQASEYKALVREICDLPQDAWK